MRLIGEVLNIDIYRLEDGYMFTYADTSEPSLAQVQDATPATPRDRAMAAYLQKRMLRLSEEMQELAEMLSMLNTNKLGEDYENE